jgi:hypothetical protein
MKSFFVLSLFVAVAIALEKPEDDNNAVRVTIEVRSFKSHDSHKLINTTYKYTYFSELRRVTIEPSS